MRVTVRCAVALMLLLGCSNWLVAGDLVGKVTAPKPEQVVVFLESVPGTFPAGHAQMDQEKKMFMPYVLPVLKGSTVSFRNLDNLAHNVFGVGADEFNLGTFGKGESREHTFNKVGDVPILCNVHPEMEAHVLVLQNPFFARLDGSSAFRIGSVPAGDYVVKAWYAGKTKKQNVKVPSNGSVTVNF